MIELMVMRHAKSSWDSGASGDHDRPLSNRGIKAAARMGAFLADANRTPTLALSSSANRARSTAESVLKQAQQAGHLAPELEVESELYGAGVEQWIELVDRYLVQSFGAKDPSSTSSTANGQVKRILVVGHQPTCSAVVHALCGARCRFPTGAIAMIRLPRFRLPDTNHRARWSGGELEWFLIPRLLE